MKQADTVDSTGKGPANPIAILPYVPPGIAAIAVVVLLGVLGASLYFAPSAASLAVVAVGLGLPLFWLVWTRPELGLLGLVFISLNFLPLDIVDIRLPLGGLDLRDVALLGMLGLMVVRELARADGPTMPWWVLSVPLLVFLGIAVFSTLYAVLELRVAPNWAFSELRSVFFYNLFFITVWAIRQRRQLVILVAGLFVLADLVAALIILQQFLGTGNPLIRAMTSGAWALWTVEGHADGFGSVRILAPGQVLTYVMAVVAFSLALFTRQSQAMRAFSVFQFLFLNFALLLTYTRAQWVASAVALGLVLLLLPRADQLRLVKYVAGVAVVLMLVYSIAAEQIHAGMDEQPFVAALTARAASVFSPSETLASNSLQWRLYETEEALRSISHYPLIGVGMGNVYREPTLMRGENRRQDPRLPRFVHNSYLYIATKMGLPGLAAFLWFALAFLIAGWRTSRTMPDRITKRMILPMLASFVGILQWSLTQHHLLAVEGTLIIGLMAGVLVVIRRLQQEQPVTDSEAQGGGVNG